MPKFVWKLTSLVPRTLYRLGLGWIIGGRILLLTTTGRVSGLPRLTPLQYEYADGQYVIGSARGLQADWVQNILKQPRVRLEIGRKTMTATGEVISDPNRVADFLEQRLVSHPFFVKSILRLHGIHGEIERETLVRYAKNRAMVVLRPQGGQG